MERSTKDISEYNYQMDVIYGYYEDGSDGSFVRECHYFDTFEEVIHWIDFWNEDGHVIWQVKCKRINTNVEFLEHSYTSLTSDNI